MEVDDAGELIFQTYYMLDWSRVPQENSDQTCLTCAGGMNKTEPFHDKRGLVYDGFVCHNCKTVFWVKRS